MSGGGGGKTRDWISQKLRGGEGEKEDIKKNEIDMKRNSPLPDEIFRLWGCNSPFSQTLMMMVMRSRLAGLHNTTHNRWFPKPSVLEYHYCLKGMKELLE